MSDKITKTQELRPAAGSGERADVTTASGAAPASIAETGRGIDALSPQVPTGQPGNTGGDHDQGHLDLNAGLKSLNDTTDDESPAGGEKPVTPEGGHDDERRLTPEPEVARDAPPAPPDCGDPTREIGGPPDAIGPIGAVTPPQQGEDTALALRAPDAAIICAVTGDGEICPNTCARQGFCVWAPGAFGA